MERRMCILSLIGKGWLYLAAVMNLYSRNVVGWSLAKNMRADQVINTLSMAIGRRKPGPGLICHSDRGVQYACRNYRKMLNQHGILSSMSRSGNCLDNAVAERFFGTLKNECLTNWTEMTIEEVIHDIMDFIEVFYNNMLNKGNTLLVIYLCIAYNTFPRELRRK